VDAVADEEDFAWGFVKSYLVRVRRTGAGAPTRDGNFDPPERQFFRYDQSRHSTFHHDRIARILPAGRSPPQLDIAFGWMILLPFASSAFTASRLDVETKAAPFAVVLMHPGELSRRVADVRVPHRRRHPWDEGFARRTRTVVPADKRGDVLLRSQRAGARGMEEFLRGNSSSTSTRGGDQTRQHAQEFHHQKPQAWRTTEYPRLTSAWRVIALRLWNGNVQNPRRSRFPPVLWGWFRRDHDLSGPADCIAYGRRSIPPLREART